MTPAEPLVFVHASGDLLLKPRESDYWIRVNPYGEIKFLRADSVSNAMLANGAWMARVGGTS